MKYNLKKVLIGEVCEVSSGLSKDKSFFGKGFPFLSFKTVFNNYFVPDVLNDLVQSSECERHRCSIKYGDIFLTRTSETQNELGMSSVALKDYPNATFNGFTKRLRIKPEFKSNIFPGYLGYYFRSPFFRSMINSMSILTTRASLNNEMINKLSLLLPAYDIQVKIFKVLHFLDTKIELNNKINDNLLNQLKASFKHDYLDNNDNKAWKNVEFGSIVSKFATGLNPRKNFVLGHGENYYVTIKNMGDNRIYLDDKCDKVDDEALIKINARSDLKQGDFLFSGIGTIGRVYYIDKTPENWNISESVFTIRPNNTVSSEFMYLLLLSDELQNYVQQHAQGSAQKGIRMADFKKYKLLLPNIEQMEKLSDMWRPLINQSKLLDEENNRLASIRDSLLPKLMSGEIDVDSIEL